MKTSAYTVVLCLALLGCGGLARSDRKQPGEGLDPLFKWGGLQEMQRNSGIILPAGCKVWNSHLGGNPEYARVIVPTDGALLMEHSIAALTNSVASFPVYVPTESPWWPPHLQNIIVSKKVDNGRYYVEAYLVREKVYLSTIPEPLPYEFVLYLKVFRYKQLSQTNISQIIPGTNSTNLTR
jgi:hypothetical protein